jgi:hypothetical protein
MPGILNLLGAGPQTPSGGGGGGGGVWTPALSGFAYHFDAARDTYTDTGLTTPGTTDGATIVGWKDQSANARHLTKMAKAGVSGVTLKTGQIDGKPALRGASDHSSSLDRAFTLAQPVTLFLVLKITTWSSGNPYICDGQGGDTFDLVMRTATPNVGMFAGSHGPQNGDMVVGTWGIFCAIFNGASSQSRVNAGTAQAGSAGTSTTGGLTLFNAYQLGTGGAGLNGGAIDIAAVLAYPSALSSGDETTARDDINSHFSNTIF